MDTNLFGALSSAQYDELKEALGLVTVLIAGADNKIDEQELNWAEKLTSIRSYAKPEELNAFYEDIETGFGDKLDQLINDLPDTVEERQKVIAGRLSGLNDIFPRLDNAVAHQLYESFTSFAKHIAKASGGFLRFGSVSSAEKEWITLPMIEPIILEELPEEEEEGE